MTEKKGAHTHGWAIAIFQWTELNNKAPNPLCFQHARAWGHAKWFYKFCKERTRDANVRNHPKWMH